MKRTQTGKVLALYRRYCRCYTLFDKVSSFVNTAWICLLLFLICVSSKASVQILVGLTMSLTPWCYLPLAVRFFTSFPNFVSKETRKTFPNMRTVSVFMGWGLPLASDHYSVFPQTPKRLSCVSALDCFGNNSVCTLGFLPQTLYDRAVCVVYTRVENSISKTMPTLLLMWPQEVSLKPDLPMGPCLCGDPICRRAPRDRNTDFHFETYLERLDFWILCRSEVIFEIRKKKCRWWLFWGVKKRDYWCTP